MTEQTGTIESITHRLEKIFYQAVDMTERHIQERSSIAQEREDIRKLVEFLIIQTKEVGQYEAGIRKRIQDCIKESAASATESMEKKISGYVAEKVETSYWAIDRLIQRLRYEKVQSSLKVMTISMVCSVLTGVLTVWLLLPKAIAPLTNEQVVYLQQGKALSDIWSKLSQAEKERLKILSNSVG